MVRDIEIGHVECFETQCEGPINLPQEQRETICSLEADSDEVSKLCEVERLHGAKEHIPSFGGIEAPGFLGLTQAPSVIVPEYVSEREWSANDMT